MNYNFSLFVALVNIALHLHRNMAIFMGWKKECSGMYNWNVRCEIWVSLWNCLFSILAWNWICIQFILLCGFFSADFYSTINAIANSFFFTLVQKPNHNILDHIFCVFSLLSCDNFKYHFNSNTLHIIKYAITKKNQGNSQLCPHITIKTMKTVAKPKWGIIYGINYIWILLNKTKKMWNKCA